MKRFLEEKTQYFDSFFPLLFSMFCLLISYRFIRSFYSMYEKKTRTHVLGEYFWSIFSFILTERYIDKFDVQRRMTYDLFSSLSL